MAIVDDLVGGVARALNLPFGWALALLTVVLGLLLGWLVRKAVLLLGEPLTRRTKTDFDDLILRAIATPLGLTVALLAILAAARIVLTDPAHEEPLARAFPTGIILVWGISLARLTGQTILRTAQRVRGRSVRGAVLLARFTKVVIGVLLVLTLFGVWGVSITPLLAGAGIAGIAIALAAQDSLANLFAGIAVYGDRLYEVGDFVVLDQGGSNELRGEVVDIGLRSTRIITRDDVLIVVPNSVIANGRVVNETSGKGQYRVHLPVLVAYESDLDRVEELLIGIARGNPLVVTDPEPRVRVRAFGDSGVRVELLAWIRDPRDRGLVVHEMAKIVHKTFAAEGIRIPFPQRDVHLHTAQDRGAPVPRQE